MLPQLVFEGCYTSVRNEKTLQFPFLIQVSGPLQILIPIQSVEMRERLKEGDREQDHQERGGKQSGRPGHSKGHLVRY